MTELSTTAGAKQLGNCLKCGWPQWEGHTHMCSTGPNFRIQQTAREPSIQRVTVEVSRGPEAIYRIDGRILSPEEIRQYIANALEGK